MKSESTAAAEFAGQCWRPSRVQSKVCRRTRQRTSVTIVLCVSGKKIMHDPMAMRPFMGYNFGCYLKHWLSLNKAPHKVSSEGIKPQS